MKKYLQRGSREYGPATEFILNKKRSMSKKSAKTWLPWSKAYNNIRGRCTIKGTNKYSNYWWIVTGKPPL